jgi:hypothetical protein
VFTNEYFWGVLGYFWVFWVFLGVLGCFWVNLRTHLLPRDFYENRIFYKNKLIKYGLPILCKIKGTINQAQIKILKIPMVGYFYSINPSK